jgi:TP901 family phage tail tape measure protein
MPAQLTVDVNGNVSQLQRDIENIVRKQYTLNLETKGQPLGRITADVGEFNKSMEAANARVVAFGASATVIVGINKAFHALIDSTIEVQKSLTFLNTILNVNQQELSKFGDNLFDLAKKTGQSFEQVSETATAFARQGIGMEETLKRTSDALILSRLSGLDAAKSVQALTAAVNSFASQGVKASEVVNKFANVDQSFAITAKDLPEAIGRVGSSAAQAGVSLDELIGLVTAAQVATSRGGAVIGNSFKTIFTRLERGKTIDLLESIGVSTKDSEGKLKSTIELLKELGKAFPNLSQQQQSQVAEKVGGVFQINILRAALADLSKEYSIYDQAVNVSKSSTDEAIQRNDALNKSYAAQLNALQQNASQLSANAGEKLFGPSISNLLGAGNGILGALNNADTNSIGAKLGNGILSGIGQILSGPGLAVIGGVLVKLFTDFSKFSAGSVKELLGLNNSSKEQVAIQTSINKILQQTPDLYKLIVTGALSTTDASKVLLNVLREQTAQLEIQNKLTSSISGNLYTGGVRIGSGGAPIVRRGKASGYIPNFSEDDIERLGAKNHKGGYTAGTVFDRTLYDGDGGSFTAKVNSAEKITDFTNSAGHRATIVEPPNGFDIDTTTAAAGYIPNFAKPAADGGVINKSPTSQIALVYGKKRDEIDKNQIGYFKPDDDKNTKYGLRFNAAGLNLPAAIKPDDADIENKLAKNLVAFTNTWISKLGGYGNKISDIGQLANAGSFSSIVGTIFETAVTYATDTDIGRTGGQAARIDFVDPNDKLRSLFHGLTEKRFEAKYANNQELRNSVAQKAYDSHLIDSLLSSYRNSLGIEPKESEESSSTPQKRKTSAVKKTPISSGIPSTLRGRASGYIPNFADEAERQAVNRELKSGATPSQIYIKQYPQLVTSENPTGKGVFSTKWEKNGVPDELEAMEKKGYAAAGYIPNFADDSSGANLGAIAIELASVASIVFANKEKIGEAFNEEILSRKAAKNSLLESEREQLAEKRAQLERFKSLSKQEQALYETDLKTLKLEVTSREKLIADLATRVELKTGEKIEAGLSAGKDQLSLAATFAPLLTSTIAQGIDQTTKSGRTEAAAVEGVGDIASFAGIGAQFGPEGAVVGGLIGGFVALTKVVNQTATSLPELQKSFDEASQNKSRFTESQNQILPLIEKLNEVREQQGGALNTKEQSDLLSQIREKSSTLGGEISGKLEGTGFNITEAKQIFIQRGTVLSDQEKQSRKNLELEKSAGAIGSETFAGNAIRGTGDFIKNIFGDSAIVEGAKRDKEKQKLAESLAGDVIKNNSNDKSKNRESAEDLAIFAKNFSDIGSEKFAIEEFGKTIGASDEQIKSLISNGTNVAQIAALMATSLNKNVIAQEQSYEQAKKFSEQYADIISILEKSKSALSTDISNTRTGYNIASDRSKFLNDFSNKRGASLDNFLGETGFVGAQNTQKSTNIYNETIGSSVKNSVNDLVSTTAETILKGVSGQNLNIKSNTSQGLLDQKGVLEGLTGSGSGNNYKSRLENTLNDALKNIPLKSFNDKTFGTSVQQFDKEAILSKITENKDFQKAYGGTLDKGEGKKALDELSKSIDKGNQDLINAYKDAANKTAQRVDELIKVTIQQLDKVGGGIDKVLSDKGPEAGRNAEEALNAYIRVSQPGSKSSDLDIARSSLKAAQAINAVSGGASVFSTKDKLFKQTQAGTEQGLRESFNSEFLGLSKAPGGNDIISSIKDTLIKQTGANLNDQGKPNNLSPEQQFQEAIKRTAEQQTAKAFGIKDTDTEKGKQLFQRQENAALQIFAGGDNKKAQELKSLYESAKDNSQDPTTTAIQSVGLLVKGELDQIQSILKSIAPKESATFASPNYFANSLADFQKNPDAVTGLTSQPGAGPLSEKGAKLDSNVNVLLSYDKGQLYNIPDSFNQGLQNKISETVKNYIQENKDVFNKRLNALEEFANKVQSKDPSLTPPPSESSDSSFGNNVGEEVGTE